MADKEIYLDKRGFTMIELLVSVAIIGLLASMATASFQEYRGRAYDATAISFQRAGITALNAVASDLDEDSYISGVTTNNLIVSDSSTTLLSTSESSAPSSS